MSEKWLARSKTIVGIILGALPTVLPMLGISFTPDDQHLMGQWFDVTFQLIMWGMAFWGRMRPTANLTMLPKLK